MYISLSGQLGSGKSTLCAYLNERLGFEIFSTGAIHRKLAKEKSLSTLDFNKLILGDKSFDALIDEEMKKHASQSRDKNVIFDSRMAWYFVPESFKVFLLVSPNVAAERVFKNRVLEEEKYKTRGEALFELIDRREIEIARFKNFYGVDCNDYENYDLFVDTTDTPTQKIAEIVMTAYVSKQKGEPFAKYNLSPHNIYLEDGFVIDAMAVKRAKEAIAEGDPLPYVLVRKKKNTLYAARDVDFLIAARECGIALIEAQIVQ